MSLRYVILHHSGIAEPHYDLLFETHLGSMLATWRSSEWPVESRTQVTRLRDHRRLYLDYEGDLSGGRGSVQRIAQGTCQVEVGENAVWSIRLLSGASPGKLVFRQIDGQQWEVEPG